MNSGMHATGGYTDAASGRRFPVTGMIAARGDFLAGRGLHRQVAGRAHRAKAGTRLTSEHMRRLSRIFDTTGATLALLGGYFLIHTLLRLVLGGGLELDEAEQMVLAQRLQPGYSPDPPLYTWLQIPLFAIFGKGLFALSLLKNLLLLGTFACGYFVARQCGMGERRAAMAALSFLLLPQIGWESQRTLTHSVLVTTLSAATLWSVLVILNGKDGAGRYLLLGGLIGLGLLSKWNYVIFLLAVVSALLLTGRRVVLRPAFVLALLLACLIASPYWIWMAGSISAATASLGKLHATGVGNWRVLGKGIYELVNAGVQFSALFLIVYVACLRTWPRGWTPRALVSRPVAVRFLVILFTANLGVLLLYLLLSGATAFMDRWLLPSLFYLPLLFFALTPSGTERLDQRSRCYQGVLLAVMVLVPVLLLGRTYVFPSFGNYSKVHYPGAVLAARLTARVGMSPLVIAENSTIGGNLKMHMPDSFVSYPVIDFPLEVLRGAGDAPVIVVWDAGEHHGIPGKIARYLEGSFGGAVAAAGSSGVIEAPLVFSHDRIVRLGYAVLKHTD
jgi:4-amino-4-deoxy-L-arabinose transferase-like glycosyltransferase